MKSIHKLIITLSTGCFLFMFSCNDQKAEQKKLQEEVMKTHDQLMMEMDKIMENKSALSLIQSKLDSLKQQNIELDTTSLSSELNLAKSKLDESDDAMMKWMNNFNPDYSDKSNEEIMSYLKTQEIKIDSVKTLFAQSLSKSDSLIAKFK